MKNRILTGILAIGILAACTQKGDPFVPVSSKQFVKFYGLSKIDEANDIKQTADGGYIIVGSVTENYGTDSITDVFYVGDKQFYVLKLDKFGNEQWHFSLGADSNGLDDVASAVQITSDGNYIVCGSKAFKDVDSLASYTNMYLVKLDQNGDTLWTNGRIGKVNVNEHANDVKELASGGFILVGYSTAARGQNQAGSKDYYMIETDANGTMLDSSQYGYYGDDEFVSCAVRVVNGEERVVVLGQRLSESVTDGTNITITPFKMSKFDAGGTSNDPDIGDAFNDYPGMIMDNGSSFIMVGTNGINGSSKSWIRNYKFDVNQFEVSNIDTSIIDTSGNGSRMEGIAICESSDGQGFVVLSNYYSGINPDQVITYVDLNGNVDYNYFGEARFGYVQLDEGKKIIKTTDGGYAILGNTKFGNDQKMVLIKVDESGKIE